jgi:hypothetical protein
MLPKKKNILKKYSIQMLCPYSGWFPFPDKLAASITCIDHPYVVANKNKYYKDLNMLETFIFLCNQLPPQFMQSVYVTIEASYGY